MNRLHLAEFLAAAILSSASATERRQLWATAGDKRIARQVLRLVTAARRVR